MILKVKNKLCIVAVWKKERALQVPIGTLSSIGKKISSVIGKDCRGRRRKTDSATTRRNNNRDVQQTSTLEIFSRRIPREFHKAQPYRPGSRGGRGPRSSLEPRDRLEFKYV